MSRNLASIDLGTHTARLLIAECDEVSRSIRPLITRRAYVHLGSDFNDSEKGVISPVAANRVLGILHEFVSSIHRRSVEATCAVATGVVREARNRDEFLRFLNSGTGIQVRVISGEEEAFLTSLGVRHALALGSYPHVVVDPGGGSTEFLVNKGNRWWARSIPMGASLLTESYLNSDPPLETEVEDLRRFIRESLVNGLDQIPFPKVFSMVGTGGTIVTLGAVLHQIPIKGMDRDRINGLKVTREAIQRLFTEMSTLDLDKRINRYELDVGRAGVFLAGVLLTIEIMQYFALDQLAVCFSDLLEGLLWQCLEDEKHG